MSSSDGPMIAVLALSGMALACARISLRAGRRCVCCGTRGRVRPRGRYWADGEHGLTRGRDGCWYCRDPHACGVL